MLATAGTGREHRPRRGHGARCQTPSGNAGRAKRGSVPSVPIPAAQAPGHATGQPPAGQRFIFTNYRGAFPHA